MFVMLLSYYSMDTIDFNVFHSREFYTTPNNQYHHYYVNNSKWSRCFATGNNNSVLNISPVVHTYDLQYLSALINEYIFKDKLMIFVLSYMRYPILSQYKCGIPMISIQVSQQYYFITDKNEFHFRNHSRKDPNKCWHKSICLYRDYHFVYKYIYDNYYHQTLEWILVLEDDIQFCDVSINFIYNILKQKSNSNPYFILLGHGFTGVLVNKQFLPHLLAILDTYLPYDIERKKHNITRPVDVDMYFVQWNEMNRNTSFKDNIYVSYNSLLYHQRQLLSKDILHSTMDHGFPTALKCHRQQPWHSYALKQLQYDWKQQKFQIV
eukprot:264837_1